MSKRVPVDAVLSALGQDALRPERSPARLKSRIFSALIAEQQKTGPLMSLAQADADSEKLCLFEDLVRRAPVGETAKAKNPCSICHARVLAENVENAPIYWPGCPYVTFQNR